MSLNANNNSSNNNHSYENLLHVYRAARASSAQQAQGRFAALPEAFRQKIFDTIKGSGEGKEEWTEVEIFQNLPVLQQAIHQVALQEMQMFPQTIHQEANVLCLQRRAHDLTEASLMCLHARSQRGELIAILDKWVSEGGQDELREDAKKQIMAFVDQPCKTALFLAGYNLKSLPPIFDRLPFVNRLSILELNDNGLRTLPPEIGRLQNLTCLSLSGNELCMLPEEICQLKHLKVLHIEHNLLLNLPENISQLLELEHLVANHNPLTDYPQEIFYLPENCRVEFFQSSLSDPDIAMIERYRALPAYQGPEIIYSQRKGKGKGESLFRLNQFLKTHFRDPRLTLSYFPALINDPRTHLPIRNWPQNISPNKQLILRQWLKRVANSRDYEQSEYATIGRVASAMELAQENPLYREKFWEIVGESTTDCGDRGALSILRLGLWRKIMDADQQDIQGFAQIVASRWPFEMLDRIAAHKIEQLQKNDEDFNEDTQVFLEYPVKLKAKLGLDSDVDLNYFSVYSRVTEDDLDRAEEFVKRLATNDREKCRFLLNQTLWFNAFAAAYPEEVKGINEYIGLKTEKLDDNQDSTVEDYDNLEKLREEMFIALIASKLSIEIPEMSLEEIIDWETDLHQTFGVAEAGAAAASAGSIEEAVYEDGSAFDFDALGDNVGDYYADQLEQMGDLAQQPMAPQPDNSQLLSIADLEAFLVSPEEMEETQSNDIGNQQ